jgi:hypothetical protein
MTMDALIECGIGQETIFERGASWLQRLIHNPQCIPPELRVPVGKGPSPYHGSYVLRRSPTSLLVAAVVWGPGDHTHRRQDKVSVLNTDGILTNSGRDYIRLSRDE